MTPSECYAAGNTHSLNNPQDLELVIWNRLASSSFTARFLMVWGVLVGLGALEGFLLSIFNTSIQLGLQEAATRLLARTPPEAGFAHFLQDHGALPTGLFMTLLLSGLVGLLLAGAFFHLGQLTRAGVQVLRLESRNLSVPDLLLGVLLAHLALSLLCGLLWAGSGSLVGLLLAIQTSISAIVDLTALGLLFPASWQAWFKPAVA